LYVVAVSLALAAVTGFTLGVTQSDRRATSSDAVPIAANLPANVVIKDAQPLQPPPAPPAPKAKPQDDDDSDEASDEAPVPAAPRPDRIQEPPPVVPGPPTKPGGSLPADLPPT
jgi:uncharacterized membrane protein